MPLQLVRFASRLHGCCSDLPTAGLGLQGEVQLSGPPCLLQFLPRGYTSETVVEGKAAARAELRRR